MVQIDNIVWIHKEIGEMGKVDRAKYALTLFTENLKDREFTASQVEELLTYFSREMRGLKINYDQTS